MARMVVALADSMGLAVLSVFPAASVGGFRGLAAAGLTGPQNEKSRLAPAFC
jgi:hypothetical protein